MLPTALRRLMYRLEDTFRRTPVQVMAVLLGVTFLLLLPSAILSPIPWMDEVMITEYGRALLTGETGYGMTSLGFGHVAPTLFYLGPLASEIAYQTAGHFGIRFLSIFFGMASVLALFVLSYRMLIDRPVLAAALAMAAGFSLNYAQNFRSGRVDSLSITCALLALIFLTMPGRATAFSTSVVLMCVAVLVWPTAIVFVPVWFLYYWESRLQWPGTSYGTVLREMLTGIGLTVLCAGSILLAVPEGLDGLEMIGTVVDAHRISTEAIGGGISQLRSVVLKDVLIFVPLFVLSVWLVLAQFRFVHAYAFFVLLAVLGFTIYTTPYVHRYIYLLFVLMVVALPALRALGPRISQLLAVCFILSAVGGWALLVGGRSYVAFSQYEDRSPATAQRVMADVTCGEETRVYLEAWKFYFALRAKNCALDKFSWAPDSMVVLADVADRYDWIILFADVTSKNRTILLDGLQARGWEQRERASGQSDNGPVLILKSPES